MRNKYELNDRIKPSRSASCVSGSRPKDKRFRNILCLRYSSRNVLLFSFQPSNTDGSPDGLLFHSFAETASDYKLKDVLIQHHRLYMHTAMHASQQMVFSFKNRACQAILLRWLIETATPVTDHVNCVNNVLRLTYCVIANRN
jgi:hypothetical protein